MLLQPLFFLIFYFSFDSRKTSEIETEKNYLLKMLFYIKSQLFFYVYVCIYEKVYIYLLTVKSSFKI